MKKLILLLLAGLAAFIVILAVASTTTPNTSDSSGESAATSQVEISAQETPEAPKPPDTGTQAETPIQQDSDSLQNNNPTESKELTVHIIDVGQADCILIKLPNEQNMLIDGGNAVDADTIRKYLKDNKVTTIDYLVITHPHADHIGGLPSIIDNTDVRSVYMPKVNHTTKTFERLMTSISNKGLEIDRAVAGVNILSDSELSLEIDIVAPVKDKYDSLNNYSTIVKLTYGDTSFIFTGDAEALSEGQITADVSADVLKVAHHGSRSSTSAAFLKRVNPEYAVICVGTGNTYGHPTAEILTRLDDAGVTVFRTDLQGTIVFTSDGENIKVDTKKAPVQGQPSGSGTGSGSGSTSNGGNNSNNNTSTAPGSNESNDMTVYITKTGKRYHLDGCSSLSNSKIETTISAAKAQGLTACGNCHPPG